MKRPSCKDRWCNCHKCKAYKQSVRARTKQLIAEGKLHNSQWIDIKTGEVTPKDWEATMEPDEVNWCNRRIDERVTDDEYYCVDSFRAARAWKSSQVRRFIKLRSCCGSEEWVEYRCTWSWSKLRFRFDKYILGFNHGH